MRGSGRLTLEIFILGVLSAFWPILIAVVVVALRSPKPTKTLGGFYAGALLTTVTIGLLIVHFLQTTELTTTYDATFDPIVRITAGVVAVAAAYVMHRRGLDREQEVEPSEEKAPPWWEGRLQGGAISAFFAGIVLDIFPGVLPFVALKNIAELEYDLVGTTAVIIGFYLIMFLIVEVPLVGYVFAPRTTEDRATRFNHWLDHNLRRVAIYALAGAGVYLVVGGVISAIA